MWRSILRRGDVNRFAGMGADASVSNKMHRLKRFLTKECIMINGFRLDVGELFAVETEAYLWSS
jgi:hypothetical protein